MQPNHIFIGFSDIKQELRSRARISKDMREIKLWFSLKDGTLYAHDYHEHTKFIIIAAYANDGWLIMLDPKSFGHKLVLKIVGTVPEQKILTELVALYDEYGHFPLG